MRKFKDLTGKVFGKWTVLGRDFSKKGVQYLCRCECGTEKLALGSDLNTGKPIYCPSCSDNRRRLPDLTGKIFDKWTVLGKDPSKPYHYLCRCECGTERSLNGSNLYHGRAAEQCFNCANKSRTRWIPDLTGQILGKWTVLGRDFSSKKIRYFCRCECGNEKTVSAEALHEGKSTSCGKCGLVGFEGKIFGKWTVLGRDFSKRRAHYICKCECGNERSISATVLRTGRSKSCTQCAHAPEDLSGKTFGKWTVLGRDLSRKGMYYICKCECGTERSVYAKALLRGVSASCGCTRFGDKPIGVESPMWGGYEDISKSYISRVKRGADKRGLLYDLKPEDLWDLFLKQNRRCALTGWEIGFGNPQTASLDRIDSSKGYILSNVQWIDKTLQKIKWDFPEDYLIKVCRAIIEHHDKTKNNL